MAIILAPVWVIKDAGIRLKIATDNKNKNIFLFLIMYKTGIINDSKKVSQKNETKNLREKK